MTDRGPEQEALERFEGCAYIVRAATGKQFLLAGTAARSPGKARRNLKAINNVRAGQHLPFFEPVELVDVVVTINHAYRDADAGQQQESGGAP